MTLHAAAPLNTMRDLQYAYTAAANVLKSDVHYQLTSGKDFSND
jgi:hypothetical protein